VDGEENALNLRELYRMSCTDDALLRGLLGAYPESLLEPSIYSYGDFNATNDFRREMYPIHLTLLYRVSTGTLLKMIRLAPEAARLPNVIGDYSLHYATGMADVRVVTALYRAQP
jgi:hypothetical protein